MIIEATGLYRNFTKALLLLCLIVAGGCSDIPVAQDVSQKQANQIVALLSDNGVAARAQKETGARGKYRVEVDSGDYSYSVGLLTRNGLPGTPKASFEELIAQRGFIPDSREIEALRIDHAMSVQLEEVLINHPNVLDAKVIVRVRSKDEESEPSVSAVVQAVDGGELKGEEVRKIISQSVPGIKPEKVFLSLHRVETAGSTISASGGVFRSGDQVVRVPLVPFLFGWHVPRDEYNSLAVLLVALIVVVGVIGALLGYWMGYFQNSRQVFESELPELGVPAGALKIEEGKPTLPEV